MSSITTAETKEGMRGFLSRRPKRRSLSPSKGDDSADRTVVSESERRRTGTRIGMSVTHVFLAVTLVIAGLGPILWLAKSAVTPTQDTLSQPFALWPNGIDWANLSTAWNDIHIDQYFFLSLIHI